MGGQMDDRDPEEIAAAEAAVRCQQARVREAQERLAEANLDLALTLKALGGS